MSESDGKKKPASGKGKAGARKPRQGAARAKPASGAAKPSDPPGAAGTGKADSRSAAAKPSPESRSETVRKGAARKAAAAASAKPERSAPEGEAAKAPAQKPKRAAAGVPEKPAAAPKSETEPAPKPEAAPQQAQAGKARAASEMAPEPAPAPAPPAERPARRGGAAGLLVGGFLAASAGFLAAQYAGNGRWPFPEREDPAARLAARLDADEERLAALESAIARIDRASQSFAGTDDLNALRARLDELAAARADQAARLEKDIAEIGQRLSLLEQQSLIPEGTSPEEAARAAAALESRIEALRSELQGRISALEDELASLREEQRAGLARSSEEARRKAEAEARQAAFRAAIAKLRAAFETGAPLAPALGQLADLGIAPPAPLEDMAQSGVPTLAALQESFPEHARAALNAAARAEAEAGKASPLTTFLRTQLGARSLTPREGDDADAVLSRAEAALRAGDLETALKELDRLPDPGKAEMAPWRAEAERRLAALAALDELAAQEIR